MGNLQMRAVAANALHDEGWFVLEADNLEEAAFLVSKVERPLGLIVCDYILGGQSGPDAVQELIPGLAVPAVYVYDAWTYVPERLRGAYAREQVLEGPLTAKSLLEAVSVRLRVGKDILEEFKNYGRSKAPAAGN
jgi:DNA-binding response OmpR family regulator